MSQQTKLEAHAQAVRDLERQLFVAVEDAAVISRDVSGRARVEDGRVRWVRVRNVPSFAVALDHKIVVPEYGTIAADVAFGGEERDPWLAG